MENKFCSAGKIVCQKHYLSADRQKSCCYVGCVAIDDDGYDFEICPWPSRQQPIKPKPHIINGLHIVDENPDEQTGKTFRIEDDGSLRGPGTVCPESKLDIVTDKMPEPAKVIIWKLENTYDSRGNMNGMTATHPQTGERYVSNNGSDWKKIETVKSEFDAGWNAAVEECVKAMHWIFAVSEVSKILMDEIIIDLEAVKK